VSDFLSQQGEDHLIEDAVDFQWLLSLAFFYFMKLRFQNSVIYDHSNRKTAEKLKVSPNVVGRHFKILLEKGLLERQGEHVKLLSYDILIGKYKDAYSEKGKIILSQNFTITQIKYALYLKIIEKKARQQMFVRRLRSDSQGYILADKAGYNVNGQQNDQPLFSLKSLSKILRVSISTSANIIGFLNSMQLISTVQNAVPFKKRTFRHYKFMRDTMPEQWGNTFYLDGTIFKIKGFFIFFNYTNKLNTISNSNRSILSLSEFKLVQKNDH
jgi:DNA-binding MarR family transcriptional regulator